MQNIREKPHKFEICISIIDGEFTKLYPFCLVLNLTCQI